MQLLVVALLIVVTIPLVVAVLRANLLFVLAYDGEQVRVVRGRIPQGLLNELGDVLRRSASGPVKLRGVSEDGRVLLYPEGELDEGQKQRLRNVIGGWPLARVRNG